MPLHARALHRRQRGPGTGFTPTWNGDEPAESTTSASVAGPSPSAPPAPPTSAPPALSVPPSSAAETPNPSSPPAANPTPSSPPPSQSPPPQQQQPPNQNGNQHNNPAPSSTPRASVANGTRSFAPTSTFSSLPSTTDPADPSSDVNMSLILGIAGGVVAAAVVAAIILFFVRRHFRKQDEKAASVIGEITGPGGFDRGMGARQSVAIPDHDPVAGMARRGPRPPSMIERHVASAPVSYGNHAPMPPMPLSRSPSPRGGPGYPAFQQQPAYGPPMDHLPPLPGSPMVPHPGFGPHGNGSMPPSPMTPVAPYSYEDPRNNAAYLNNQVNYAAGPVPASPMSPASPPGRSLTAQRRVESVVDNEDDSSIIDQYGRAPTLTPFQAAQYAEISRQLNSTPGPQSQVTGTEQTHIDASREPTDQIGKGPFADNGQLPNPYDNNNTNPPPSPRVASPPPMLPPVALSSDGPGHTKNSGSFGMRGVMMPPASGSPTVASYGEVSRVPAGLNEKEKVAKIGYANTSAPAATTTPNANAKNNRPETVYDAEDAYGGI